MKKTQNTKKSSENKAYINYIKSKDPKTNLFNTLFSAFVIGGIICLIGQGFFDLTSFLLPDADKSTVSSIVTAVMIFLGAFFTGLGVYDDLGKFAGAGSIIPITGFANSVVSPAIEFKTEGIIYGIESKMFVIAGPIIVSGIVSSAIVGLIYYIIGLF